MNIALWIVQVILGAMIFFIGLVKTFQPIEMLTKLSWTTRSSEPFIRFVGISEILIGMGLILPELTGVLPLLTPVAAVCLGIIMVLAIIEHMKYRETNEIWKNVLIILFVVFIAAGRLFLFL